jgi:thioredoxin 1
MLRRRRHAHEAATESHAAAEIAVIDDATFEELTAGRPTVLDLWAPWCGPCRSFRPIFETVAGDWQHRVRFGSCNVDDNPTTPALLQVQSIPTVIAFGPDGSEIGRLVGVPSRGRFEAFVADAAATTPSRRA